MWMRVGMCFFFFRVFVWLYVYVKGFMVVTITPLLVDEGF